MRLAPFLMKEVTISTLGFFFIWSSTVCGQNYSYFECKKESHHTACGTSQNKGVFRLPENIDPGINELHLGPDPPVGSFSYEVMDHLELQKFKSLSKLVINVKIWLFSFEVAKSPNALTENLFFLQSLSTLIIKGANLNIHQHSWKLPSSLTSFTLENSNFASFDLSGCPKLISLNLKGNRLVEFPALPHPLPPIKYLEIDHPLFTVNDLADFCQASVVKFNYLSFGSKHRRCECQRLKGWVDETKAPHIIPSFPFPETVAYTTSYTCNTSALPSKLCKKYTLKEAREIRHDCRMRFLKHPSRIIHYIMAALTFVFLVVYCYYKYLDPFIQQNLQKMKKPTDVKQEAKKPTDVKQEAKKPTDNEVKKA